MALRDAAEMLRALSDAAFEGILMHRDGIIRLANRAAEQLAGVAPGGLVGRPLLDFIAPASTSIVRAKIAADDDRPYEAFAMRADGTTYPIEVQVRTVPVALSSGSLRVVALRDLTARRALEAQYQQAQKMEAIGQLAGGVAHDFNNLLAVIMSATTLAARGLPADHASQGDLGAVLHAAERAAELTRQLLAFSRKQRLQPRRIDVNRTLVAAASMIRRLLSEDIELVVTPAPTAAWIVADPGQLELMLMNLASNARDAMPSGGRLTLEARHMVEADSSPAGLELGPHVRISVSDTGAGMDVATQARIFEPFFTTKVPGHGTGLGLAMAFGIVKQSGGDIWVQSAPGQGTTFEIAFPGTEADLAIAGPPAADVECAPDRTVLVVEDEPLLLRIVVEVLTRAGYRVLEAAGPLDALALARAHLGEIDLLLTDTVMPQMSGPQLARVLAAERQGLRILLMSGYVRDTASADACTAFLPKPFTPDHLLAAVRDAAR